MVDRQGTGGSGTPPDLQALARDWITIWQSELSALATDRELQEGWTRMVGLWAAAAGAGARLIPAAPDGAAGRPGAAPSAGPASPVAAPDAGGAGATRASDAGAGDELRRLGERVAELERRLAPAGPLGGAGAPA